MAKRLTREDPLVDTMGYPMGGPGACEVGERYAWALYERLRYYEDLEDAGRYIVLAEPERAGVDRLRELAAADLAGHAEIVVHCRDCRSYLPIAERCGFCDSAAGMARPNADDYCSRGVRKEPEREDNDG